MSVRARPGADAAKRILFFALLVALVGLDQAVKAWVRGALPQGGSFQGLPWPGVFELTLTYNTGIAFGLFGGKGVAISPVALAIAGGAVWHSLRHPRESGWSHAAYALLAAGALGNLIDRVWRGRVTDMLYVRIVNFPVFNLADVYITFATALLILLWWREAARRGAPTPAPESSPEPNAP